MVNKYYQKHKEINIKIFLKKKNYWATLKITELSLKSY